MRVFENKVQMKIFGSERDKVTGEWRTLHNEQFGDLYSSPNMFPMIQPTRMRWVGHVACKGDRRDA